MLSRLKVERGKEEDFKACVALAKEAGFNVWANSSIKLWAQREHSIFLTAKKGDQVLGFVLSRDVLGESEILVICVKKKYRNTGIGDKLVSKLLKKAQKQKIHDIFLEVNVNNKAAVTLYKNNGFNVVGRRKKYYDNREDAYVMRRKI